MAENAGDVTQLLGELRRGDASAAEKLFPMVYSELRQIAGRQMRGERPNHTWQPTALVNEAYLRIVGGHACDWQSRAHFIAVAAQTMRHLLVDHARARHAGKRGGGVPPVSIQEGLTGAPDRTIDVLDLHEALEELATRDPRQVRVVELRFFGGLTLEETAEILQISERTVSGEWEMARAWLFGRLNMKAKRR